MDVSRKRRSKRKALYCEVTKISKKAHEAGIIYNNNNNNIYYDLVIKVIMIMIIIILKKPIYNLFQLKKKKDYFRTQFQ